MKFAKFLSSILAVSSLVLLAGCGGKQADAGVSHEKNIPSDAIYEVCQDPIGEK